MWFGSVGVVPGFNGSMTTGGRLTAEMVILTVAVFESRAGLTWKDSAGREQSLSGKELADWRGNRADAGRLAHGLPKSNKFLRGVE